MKLVVSLFLVGVAALPASPIAVSIVDAGNPPVVDSNGEYVGPYTLSVNGTNIAALCVDDKDRSQLNVSWKANETAVSSPNLSNTYKPSEGQEYKEAAYLYSLITQPGVSGTDRIDIQHAAWYIMDGKTSSVSTSDGAYLYIQKAASNYNFMDFSGYEIVSSANQYNRQQEFIIDTTCPAPEPASVGLFGAGLIIAAAISSWVRRNRS
jgi:hypothetical protein